MFLNHDLKLYSLHPFAETLQQNENFQDSDQWVFFLLEQKAALLQC